jgi:Tfp pilus assembly protein PilF
MAKKNTKENNKEIIKENKPPSNLMQPNLAQRSEPQSVPIWLLLGLFVFAFALYANTLGHGYAFDDSIVIVENSFTKKGFAGIKDLATRDFFDGIYGDQNMALSGGRYRPLSLVMFAVEYEFFGANPAVGHFLNVFFFALTVVLFFVLTRRWLANLPNFAPSALVAATVAALLFAAQPIHTEVVANIKGRDEIMAMLMMLLSLLSLDKYLKNGAGLALIGALAAFFLSMLSKENSFAFAILLPILLPTFYPNRSAGKSTAIIIAFSGAAIAYFALRYAMVGGFGAHNPDIMENPFVNSDFSQKFGTIGLILLKYLQLSLLPLQFSSDYSFNQIPFVSLFHPLSILGWLIYAGIGAAGVWLVYRRNVYGFATWLFLLPLGPTTNIFFNIGAPMAERFLYLPTWGLCLAAGVAFVRFSKQKTLGQLIKSPWALPFFAIIAAYSFLTLKRNPDWKNNEILFAADVKTAPNSAKMQYYYGNTLLTKYLNNKTSPKAKEYLAQAEAAFTKSVQINPKFHTVIYNLGLVAWNQEDGAKAAKHLETVLAMQPTHISSTELLGKVYARFLGNTDKAQQLLETAINTYGRKTADNYSALGIVYAMKGEPQKGIELFKQALAITDSDPDIWQNYAQLCAQVGDKAAADKAMQRAAELRK